MAETQLKYRVKRNIRVEEEQRANNEELNLKRRKLEDILNKEAKDKKDDPYRFRTEDLRLSAADIADLETDFADPKITTKMISAAREGVGEPPEPPDVDKIKDYELVYKTMHSSPTIYPEPWLHVISNHKELFSESALQFTLADGSNKFCFVGCSLAGSHRVASFLLLLCLFLNSCLQALNRSDTCHSCCCELTILAVCPG